MRGILFLCVLTIAAPSALLAQTPQKKDSVAKADSATADSIALVRQLEKELGASSTDTTTSAAPATPRATGGYMNIGFVSLTDAGWATTSDVGSLEPGDHDPHVRGFTLPNTELTFDGAVDPYF